MSCLRHTYGQQTHLNINVEAKVDPILVVVLLVPEQGSSWLGVASHRGGRMRKSEVVHAYLALDQHDASAVPIEKARG